MADQKPLAQQYQTPLGPMGLDDMINRAASINGVDPEWIRAMTHQEDPTRDPAAVSPKGAVGHMQVMPDSYFRKGARSDYRSDISWMDPATNQMRTGVNIHDPYENVMGGVAYFKSLLDRYGGDRTKALAAYNAGPKRVDEHGGVPPIKETQDYVSKIEGRLGEQQPQQQPAIAQQQQPAIAGAGGAAAAAAPAIALPAAAQPRTWADFPSLNPAPPEPGPPPFATGVVPGAQPTQLPTLAPPGREPAISAQMGVPRIAIDPRTGVTTVSPPRVPPGQQIPPELWRQAQREAIEQTRPVVPPITAPYGTPEYNTQLMSQLEARANLARWQQEHQGTLSRVLNTIGDIVAPAIMERVPGTERYREAQGAAAQAEVDRMRQLGVGEMTAQAALARAAEGTLKFTTQGLMRFNPQTQQMEPMLYMGRPIREDEDIQKMIGGMIGSGQDPSQLIAWYQQMQRPTAEVAKERFERQLSMVPGLTAQDKLDYNKVAAATQASDLPKQVKDDIIGYMATNPLPSTRLEMQQRQIQMKEGEDWVVDPRDGGFKQAKEIPAEVPTPTPIKRENAEAFKQTANTSDVIADAFNSVVSDVNRSPFIFDDDRTRAVVTSALSSGGQSELGVTVLGTAIRLPAGLDANIKQLLIKNMVPEENRKAVEKFLVDYYAFKDKLLAAQIEMQGNKVGRGFSGMFEAMTGQLPGIQSADSYMARQALGVFGDTLYRLRSQFGAEMPDGSFKSSLLKVDLDPMQTYERQPDGSVKVRAIPAGKFRRFIAAHPDAY